MASNVIAFPSHRVTRNPDLEASRAHISQIRAVLATSKNQLQIDMGLVMLAFYEREGVFDHQNDNIIPLRRA